jgi:hypothetical protein
MDKGDVTRIPGTDVVAAVPKDDLRSLFYLFSGKPDSKIKIFSEAICLDKEDIAELHAAIGRKLATHNIDTVIVTVKVSYTGSQISEFGTWAEFTSHTWSEPECVEEVVVKWDFLVSIENYNAPQRHTITVRVSRDIKPTRLIQMMAAGNSDELDNVEVFSAPAFCRVDFINAQISKELINEVSDWYKGRGSPKLIPQHWYWFKNKKQYVAEFFEQWFVFSWSLLLASILYFSSQKVFSGNPSFVVVGIAVFLAIYSLRPASRVANHLAKKIFRSLSALEGSRVAFSFTSGDKRRIAKLEEENEKKGNSFMWMSAWNILLNIAATSICVYFLRIS